MCVINLMLCPAMIIARAYSVTIVRYSVILVRYSVTLVRACVCMFESHVRPITLSLHHGILK
jgi:hypothetical protein